MNIANFFYDSWKKLVLAAVAGAVLGLSSSIFLGSYTSEYVLINNNPNGIYTLDLVTWKSILKSLPNLASQIEEEAKNPHGQGQIYEALSSAQWWQKNVTTGYAISKSDTKDLAAISKDFDFASTSILSITIKAEGSTRAKSIENVQVAAEFLRTGGAYLQLRSLLGGYESEIIFNAADLQKKISSTEIEMGYQVRRAKSLEDLLKRFPGGNNATNLVVDIKDSGAKYLPLTAQIIAVNTDINQSKESLQRFHGRLNKIMLMKAFVEQANPIAQKTFNGLALGDDLLALESSLRSKLAKDDFEQQEVLDQIKSQILFIKTRFTAALTTNTTPVTVRFGMIKAATSGLVGLLFLAIMVLLGQRSLANIKSSSAK